MKSKIIFLILISLMIINASCEVQRSSQTLTGLDLINKEAKDLISGRKVGIVTNHTAYNRNGEHLSDILYDMDDVMLTTIFAPEHGFRGQAEAGEHVSDDVDPATGAKIYSIYGSTRKPTKEMLENVEVLIFDIQDVGARFYTYISTMGYIMEAGAENGIPVIILDRPNPLGGKVEGPVLDMEWVSFVGMYPIPLRHGLTVGELALMIKGEGWVSHMESLDLTVIKMENWNPTMYWEETGLKWIGPSPNISHINQVAVYPGMCLFEATNFSDGRGTDHAFEWVGADFVKSDELINAVNKYNIKGLTIKPHEFMPVDLPGKAMNPKFKDQTIQGFALTVTDWDVFESVRFGVICLKVLLDLYPGEFLISREVWLNRLWGQESLGQMLEQKASVDEIMTSFQDELNEYLYLKSKYALY